MAATAVLLHCKLGLQFVLEVTLMVRNSCEPYIRERSMITAAEAYYEAKFVDPMEPNGIQASESYLTNEPLEYHRV